MNREPALVIEAIRALLLLGVVFGLPLNDEQTAAILVAIGALAALATRARVTPTNNQD